MKTLILKMLAVLLRKKLIEWVVFYFANMAVASTETKHDDKFLKEFKKAWKDSK